MEELNTELKAVRAINQQSRRCTDEHDHEPEWNNAVHGEVLRLALAREDGVGFRYMYVRTLLTRGCY